ncbi:MAG: riboflavin synthase [Deltaproteobacteria bacterium]|nr:riboflavin synthase [Deltaproteobacteria bacterium]
MFTGIIEGQGQITQIEKLKHSLRMSVRSPFSLSKEKLGDSIAVDGCCLTITQKKGSTFSVDISPETLVKTCLADCQQGSLVNLERALRLGDRLGGHWVQGHVDTVATIGAIRWTQEKDGKYLWLKIAYPKNLRKYLVSKGSITVSGVSLTINDLKKDTFELCLIPHTQKMTTLTAKKVGDRVNLEVDILVKYVESILGKS